MKKTTLVVAALLAVLLGCWGTKPALYGGQLAACTEASSNWYEYQKCCESAALREHRDPGFCIPDITDAGAKDAAHE